MDNPVNIGLSPTGLILSAQSAAETVGLIPGNIVRSVRELALYVVFSAGCSAGAVVVEGAHSIDYTGTWANLATVNWAAASRVHNVAITGCHLAVRVRISSEITGGTIDVYGTGN